LVNDLTTGGTTKALTAEMGKLLQTNKVDKVAGERLINAAEITKLSGLANVTTTTKTILSTVLATQNVAGFVAYINALNPVLVVAANEIVKYTTSDTGRTFELNFRGRSFGVGQPAIVAADVMEVTSFLNKDINLSNYPSTRNDGQLPTNKVLSTDAAGNLKLYTIATSPAPYLNELIPDSYLPSTTGNFILKGAFFTPSMTVSITGQTVNYVTFISDNEVRANVTTGAAEGNFDVILNNGLSATFSGRMLIVLGTVYKPLTGDWTSKSNIDVAEGDYAKILTAGTVASALWTKEIDYTKNWIVSFKYTRSPFIASGENSYLYLTESVGGASKFSFRWITGNLYIYHGASQTLLGVKAFDSAKNIKIKKTGSIVALYINETVFAYTLSDFATVTSNLKIYLALLNTDIKDIRYIETA
ncbi:hypothetical protein, partial [Flavobacterium geliluteum]